MLYVNVVVDIPLYTEFTYTFPSSLRIGTRVLVEFGTKQVIGFVWQTDIDVKSLEFDLSKLKPILHVFNDTLHDDIIDLIKFTATYYHYPIGQALFTAIPTVLRKKKFDDIVLENLYVKYKNKSSNKLKINNKNKTNPPELATNAIGHTLNSDQQYVVNEISKNLSTFQPYVLHGITGSGKTEVYLELIATTIANNLQVLVLVPEINLTPQLLKRFRTRFPAENIVILTSNISENERFIGYRDAASGEAPIVIGTRLSVFTPFKQLGLIIVDEEHDQSFKQNEGLRYHARDLAVYRAKYYSIPVVLGSATPSLETLYNYKLGRYHLFKLANRAVSGAELPKIQLIDLQTIKSHDGLAATVIDSINMRMQQQELSLIFINRRGYAPVIRCYDCGFVSRCKNCSSNMVYHHLATKSYLKCHHCGVQNIIPIVCSECRSQNLQALGHGTQKIEESINKIFPNARVHRIDYDTTNTKDAWDILYNKINNHEVDILVGTQMLAKGHDFPNLTLVVGLNLDNGLYSYDFRATEFLFAQLMQVAGRAGRGGKPGVVMLQTFYPRHELYQYLCRHDFIGFANYLLEKRKLLQLPPYTNYALFRASAPSIKGVMKYLGYIFEIMQSTKNNNQEDQQIYIYAPVPCVMQRLKNRERGQILILSNNRMQLHKFLTDICNKINELKPWYGINWHLDIDPVDL